MSLGYKMLLRKRGTGLSILAISLLVAIPASMGSVVNYINSQVEILGGLVIPSKTYIIMSKNSTPSESRVNISIEKLRAVSSKIFPQKIIQANLTGFKVRVRGISNMSFLTGIKGRAAENINEADVGKILAKTLNISTGENITLSAKKALTVRVVGIIESKTQLDAEIVVPLETAWELSGDRSMSLILIEDPKDDKIRSILPDNLELVQAQCIREFVQQTNLQTLSFLNAWSIAVYAAVSAASYTIATRLITESSYELTMLSALGAKKRLIFALILCYTTTVALIGSILGISLGVAGAQIASTLLRWIKNTGISPFLDPLQAFQILLLTLISSVLGCIYPALKPVGGCL
ncbi:ABC transporter permease [Candidatus Methanodesulfokora washburnensis]|uniref:FtsX-like permease family protein n=1 Tax=Candidatus Methanodesulfokora washburnensis TaxID=2478471 RepID=A0A3R9PH72_9CREN|nr:FtsX-like permease family protein [Candidatus Methanodesulfokores washburnensis]RSN73451.1 FtsX-like permease family protein [Candidatus Methanodesulfokores washburnensis]